MTVSRIVAGLQQHHHQVQLVARARTGDESAAQEPRFEEVLQRGISIPRYHSLRMGLPAKQALLRLWTRKRPDIVHIVDRGPTRMVGACCRPQAQDSLQHRLPHEFSTVYSSITASAG